jgi:hypothetical protein
MRTFNTIHIDGIAELPTCFCLRIHNSVSGCSLSPFLFKEKGKRAICVSAAGMLLLMGMLTRLPKQFKLTVKQRFVGLHLLLKEIASSVVPRVNCSLSYCRPYFIIVCEASVLSSGVHQRGLAITQAPSTDTPRQ